MTNNDQQTVDLFYNAIYLQQIRCDHFYIGPHCTNSIWNRHPDEKNILNTLIKKYKNFYIKKAEELKKKVLETKEDNIKSYLTYDPTFYIKLYDNQVEEIDKYILDVENKTDESIQKDRINFISKGIDELFPNYLVTPVLHGLL